MVEMLSYEHAQNELGCANHRGRDLSTQVCAALLAEGRKARLKNPATSWRGVKPEMRAAPPLEFRVAYRRPIRNAAVSVARCV